MLIGICIHCNGFYLCIEKRGPVILGSQLKGGNTQQKINVSKKTGIFTLTNY